MWRLIGSVPTREIELWQPIYTVNTHHAMRMIHTGMKGQQGAVIRALGEKRIQRRFPSFWVSSDKRVLAILKGGENTLERGRCTIQSTETLTTFLDSKFSLLPSSAGWLNNVLDNYLHVTDFFFFPEVLLSSFNFICKSLDHLNPDYFWDCFFTLAPTQPLGTTWFSPLIPKLAWE